MDEILVGFPFYLACKNKSKGGLLWNQQIMVTHWKNRLSILEEA